MTLDHLWNILRSVWPVLGPFAGIWIGVYLSTRTQKRQWIRDNKRLEYRELLTALADAMGKLVLYYRRKPFVSIPGAESDISETITATVGVIYNRLFIAKEVVELNLLHRWQETVTLLTDKHDPIFFGKSMDRIMEDIRKRALKEFS